MGFVDVENANDKFFWITQLLVHRTEATSLSYVDAPLRLCKPSAFLTAALSIQFSVLTAAHTELKKETNQRKQDTEKKQQQHSNKTQNTRFPIFATNREKCILKIQSVCRFNKMPVTASNENMEIDTDNTIGEASTSKVAAATANSQPSTSNNASVSKSTAMDASVSGNSVMASPATVPSVTVSLHPLVIMNISEHWTRIRAQNGSPQQGKRFCFHNKVDE